MAIVGTFQGLQIISTPITPTSANPNPSGRWPKSIDYAAVDLVGTTVATYTGQRQSFNWRSGWQSLVVQFPPMTRAEADPWIAFLKDCEGSTNAFQLPNPLQSSPKGAVSSGSAPVVDSSNPVNNQPQSQLLVTRGWAHSQFRLLLPNDAFNVGYYLYSVLDVVNSDASGDCTLRIWPRLRGTPNDGAPLVLHNPMGLYQLAGNERKWSLGLGGATGLYTLSFNVVEALPQQ